MAADREALKRKLFRKCDRDGDLVLKRAEMRVLAGLVGFEGSDEEWDEEYRKLCEEHHINAQLGIPEMVVMELLDDESDSGCYCTNQELMQLLEDDLQWMGAGANGGGQAARAQADSTRIFFAGANFNTDESVLEQVFQEAGRIDEFTLFRMQDGRSRGMGRVQYSSVADARRAISLLNQRELEGRKLMVKEDSGEMDGKGKGKGKDYYGYDDKGKGKGKDWGWFGGGGKGGEHAYVATKTIFFAGAAFETTPGFLQKQFQEAGRVNQFWLFQLPDGRSRGMGVVEYQTVKEAQYAIQIMHGRSVDGRELLVKDDGVGALQNYQWYQQENAMKGKGTRWGGGGGGDWGKGKGDWDKGGGFMGSQPVSNRVFFAGAPFQIPGPALQEYFAEFGEVRSFTVFRLPDGRSRGMGVCTFQSTESAAGVMTHGITVDSRPLYLQEDTSQYVEQPREGMEKGFVGDFKGKDKGKGKGDWKGKGKGKGYDYWEEHDYQGYTEGIGSAAVAQVDPNKSVFFANVPFNITEAFLRKQFETVGRIKTITLFTTPDGRSRGMGVVEFTHPKGAERAYYELHESMVSGRSMVVDEFRPPGA